MYWFCHMLTWIRHGCTCVPHPKPPSQLPPHPIPLGHASVPAPGTLSRASDLDWWFISHMIIYMFQCHSLISSCPRPLPYSPKDCSIHLCLSCCLAYWVILFRCPWSFKTFFLSMETMSLYNHVPALPSSSFLSRFMSFLSFEIELNSRKSILFGLILLINFNF